MKIRVPPPSLLVLGNCHCQSVNHAEVLAIFGDEGSLLFDGSCRDERIEGPQTVRLRVELEEFISASSDGFIDWDRFVSLDEAIDEINLALILGAGNKLQGRMAERVQSLPR